MVYGEFNLINKYFNRIDTKRRDVILGIGDDCAVLSISKKQHIAISTDTLTSGTHFLENISPKDLGYKSLAVNLSDLAAIGADPAWLSLAITLPSLNKAWLSAYSDSLFKQLDYYKMQLIGGDTVCGPLSITLTIYGLLPKGKALTRSGASVGDFIYVTGTLGDSAAGLAILQRRLNVKDKRDYYYLINRHLRPQPRIRQGQILRNIASSAIDISDGLIGDLCKILSKSNCGAKIYLDNIPNSKSLKRNVSLKQAIYWSLSGGEDYELCFTVSEYYNKILNHSLNNSGVQYTCIGKILPKNKGLKFVKNSRLVRYNYNQYDHFNQYKL